MKRILVCACCLLAAACGGSSPRSPTTPTPAPAAAPQPSYTVSSFIAGASSAEGTQATFRSGSAPTAGSGPAATPTSNNSVINGGSNQVRIRSASPFQVIYIFVAAVPGGVGGYWELRLTSPTSDTTILVSLARQIPASSFDCVYAVATSTGPVGPYNAVQTRLVPASTGDVQVSASWDAPSDVDLHVVDPRGEEIYYGNTISASGGQLDLDSNAGCQIDNTNNENIRWLQGRAPIGTYIVRLDYWSNCGVASTNYVVTVNNGGSSQTFRGNFTGAGTSGSLGAGRLITSFSRAVSGVSSSGNISSPPRLPLSPDDVIRVARKLAASHLP